MSRALGIDLGGTKILAGVIDIETGDIVSRAIRPTREGSDNELVDRIAHVAQQAVAACPGPITAVGIGVAGQVESSRGTVLRAPNLPATIIGVPLAGRIEALLGAPTVVVNDVVAAGAGESGYGAGSSYPNFVCVFVGTGIGGAVIEGGVVREGHTNTAGELGHMVIHQGGRVCSCGGRGHLEAYASHSAVMRSILGGLRLGRKSVLSAIEPNPNPDDRAQSAIHYRALAEAIQASDELAVETVREGAVYLAAGLASIINFYNPPLLVLGGGMIDELDLFFEVAASRARAECLAVPRDTVSVARARLGANSGIVGAARIAVQRLQVSLSR